MDSNLLFMAYDGDNAGRLVGRAVLANDVDALSEVSQRIQMGHEIVRKWVEANGGKVISGGGDEGTFAIPAEAVEAIEELRKDYQFATNLTMTVGVGKDLSQAGKALMAGKLRGKNTVVNYDKSVDGELQTAHQHVGAGTGSEEENKLDEAYLNTEDEAAKAAQASPGDGPRNEQDEDADNDGQGEFSDGKNHDAAANREAKGDDVAPGSTEENPGQGVEPDAENEQAQNEDQQSKFDPQGEAEGNKDPKAQPNPTTEGTEEQEEPMSDKSKQPLNKEKPNEKPQEKGQEAAPAGKESPQASNQEVDSLKQEVDQASAESNSQEKGVMDNIDDADLATGHMDGKGVDDKDSDQVPGDMGLGDEQEAGAAEGADPKDPSAESEEGEAPMEGDEAAMEDPNYEEVLGDAVASEQQNIQKEKVVQMVAEALEGFKNQRHILERAKEQAPELYNSSLKMLRAMIEMAKLLGFGDGLNDPEHDAQQDQADGLFADAEGAEGEEGMPADDQPFLDGHDEGEGAPAPKDDKSAKPDLKGGKPDAKSGKADDKSGKPDAKDGKKPSFPPKKEGGDKKPEAKEKAPAEKKQAGQ